MNSTAIHGLGEFDKMITVESVTGVAPASTTTTYIGYAHYDEANYSKNYTGVADLAKPIFKIKKIVESDDGAGNLTTETFSPSVGGNIVQSYDLIWDDGTSNFLNYTYV